MTSHEEKEINNIDIEIKKLETEKIFLFIAIFFKKTKELMFKNNIENIVLYRESNKGIYQINDLNLKYKKNSDEWVKYRVNQAFEEFNIKMPEGWYIVQYKSSLKADEFNFTKDLLFDEFLKKCFPPKYAIIFLNDKIEKQLPLKDEPEAKKMKI